MTAGAEHAVGRAASSDPRRNPSYPPSTPIGDRLRDVLGALQRAAQAVWLASFAADGNDHAEAARQLAEGWAHVERVRAEADALALRLALPGDGAAVAR